MGARPGPWAVGSAWSGLAPSWALGSCLWFGLGFGVVLGLGCVVAALCALRFVPLGVVFGCSSRLWSSIRCSSSSCRAPPGLCFGPCFRSACCCSACFRSVARCLLARVMLQRPSWCEAPEIELIVQSKQPVSTQQPSQRHLSEGAVIHAGETPGGRLKPLEERGIRELYKVSHSWDISHLCEKRVTI